MVGHDWGGPVAWHSALLRPDRVRAVAGLSVPYQPRGSRPPTVAMRAGSGEGFYMIYFQEPGVADEELGRDPRRTLRMLLYSASGDAPQAAPIVPPGGGFLDFCQDPETLPDWLTEARSGRVRGGLRQDRLHRRPELVPQPGPHVVS